MNTQMHDGYCYTALNDPHYCGLLTLTDWDNSLRSVLDSFTVPETNNKQLLVDLSMLGCRGDYRYMACDVTDDGKANLSSGTNVLLRRPLQTVSNLVFRHQLSDGLRSGRYTVLPC